MKRYAIVPLDRYNCPKYYYEWFKCKHCGNCAELWGDTKEQLVRKIEQVLFKEELGWYKNHIGFIPKGKIDEPFCRNIYEHCLEKARKIVEFLGVEE